VNFLVLNNVEKNKGETRSIYYYYGQSDVHAYIPTCACSVVPALREKQKIPRVPNVSPNAKNRELGEATLPRVLHSGKNSTRGSEAFLSAKKRPAFGEERLS
jgi:hypothetical protein